MLWVKQCQLLHNTTFHGHNSMSRPDPLRVYRGGVATPTSSTPLCSARKLYCGGRVWPTRLRMRLLVCRSYKLFSILVCIFGECLSSSYSTVFLLKHAFRVHFDPLFSCHQNCKQRCNVYYFNRTIAIKKNSFHVFDSLCAFYTLKEDLPPSC